MSDAKTKNMIKYEETIFLQYGGREASVDTIRAAIKENYESVKKGKDAPEDVKIYLKPEDAKAYYVINDDYAGEVPLLDE